MDGARSALLSIAKASTEASARVAEGARAAKDAGKGGAPRVTFKQASAYLTAVMDASEDDMKAQKPPARTRGAPGAWHLTAAAEQVSRPPTARACDKRAQPALARLLTKQSHGPRGRLGARTVHCCTVTDGAAPAQTLTDAEKTTMNKEISDFLERRTNLPDAPSHFTEELALFAEDHVLSYFFLERLKATPSNNQLWVRAVAVRVPQGPSAAPAQPPTYQRECAAAPCWSTPPPQRRRRPPREPAAKSLWGARTVACATAPRACSGARPKWA